MDAKGVVAWRGGSVPDTHPSEDKAVKFHDILYTSLS
jgi:hypothetical protein